MREIKYRFWDCLMCAWATDCLAINDGRMVADNEGKEFVDVPDVERFIPVQYTGLKDKNGVEVYEGDVLSNGMINPKLFTVKWEESGARFIGEGSEIRWAKDFQFFEVIGNVYDNPELLDG